MTLEKSTVVSRLLRLESQDPVDMAVPEDLLARLYRLETALRTTMLSTQPATEAMNTLRVDVNKLLEEQSSLPNRSKIQCLDHAPTISTHKHHQQPGPSSDNPASHKLRSQARMETIDLVISTRLTFAHLRPLESHVLFTDNISNVSLE